MSFAFFNSESVVCVPLYVLSFLHFFLTTQRRVLDFSQSNLVGLLYIKVLLLALVTPFLPFRSALSTISSAFHDPS